MKISRTGINKTAVPKINTWVYLKNLNLFGKVVAFGYNKEDSKGHRVLALNNYASFNQIHGIVIRVVGKLDRNYRTVRKISRETLREIKDDYFEEPIGYYQNLHYTNNEINKVKLTEIEQKKFDALLFIDDLKGGIDDETKN